jgi:hypothetical protein
MYAYVTCSVSDDFDEPVGICGTKIKIQILKKDCSKKLPGNTMCTRGKLL